MDISLTKKEYRLLLDIFAITDWVMNAHRAEDDPRTKPYHKLEQKILSYAKDVGFEKLIDYDEDLKEYVSTLDYEELKTDRQFIDEFEEEVFWDHLIMRLAVRDHINEKGLSTVRKMDPMDRMIEEDRYVEKYEKEFVEHGLDNIRISKD